jgi:hypothetical protein
MAPAYGGSNRLFMAEVETSMFLSMDSRFVPYAVIPGSGGAKLPPGKPRVWDGPGMDGRGKSTHGG